MSKLTAKLARERMDAAREHTARELLAWEAVAGAISTAAGKGYALALFVPPAGVSIKTTTTAAALIERLTGAGFRTDWRERRDPGDALNHDLAVSWEGASLGA